MKTEQTENEGNDLKKETDGTEKDEVGDDGEKDEPVAIAEGEWEE